MVHLQIFPNNQCFNNTHFKCLQSIFNSNLDLGFVRVEKVNIGFGTCKDPSFIPIYVASKGQTYIMVLIEGVFDAFEECKLFILMLIARYLGLVVGMEIVWSLKDLAMENYLLFRNYNNFSLSWTVVIIWRRNKFLTMTWDLPEILSKNVVEV